MNTASKLSHLSHILVCDFLTAFFPQVLLPHKYSVSALVSIRSLSLSQTCPDSIFQSQETPPPSQAQILISLKIELARLLPPCFQHQHLMGYSQPTHHYTMHTLHNAQLPIHDRQAINTSQHNSHKHRKGVNREGQKLQP